jgi:hypothetical protein
MSWLVSLCKMIEINSFLSWCDAIFYSLVDSDVTL